MKKKIISVVGARPNFMKVAPLDRAFKKYAGQIQHLIVHTGQHYDVNMSDAFFHDLEMPQPAYFLGVGSGSHAEQTANIMLEFEKVCIVVRPDLVIVVGDVNSTIACALTAIKLGIRVAHVESGLRSGDRTMPEEINRITTDSICDYCFVTEQSGLDNLLKEGRNPESVFFTGNTMIDSQFYASEKAKKSRIMNKLNLCEKEYILITLHRPSNVDSEEQLRSILEIFSEFSSIRKIVFPVHPRTRKNISNFGLEYLVKDNSNIMLTEPLGYIDFLNLMMNSDFVLTDSGGIQEETTALGIPCITTRTTTERPVTIDLGTNRLILPTPENIRIAIAEFIEGKRPKPRGSIPYWDGKAGERIVDKIINILEL
ncbi:MAG: UDP-N-acetylglucosamine 2-epimerase (non-hydrolyzing) [bacterium]